MRIVKLSDLSDEERKKVLEEQQVRLENNRQANEQNRINGNNQFNSMWDKIQSRANNNLNQSNNMQKVIDFNTRNQMARNMEDYVSTKRTAMQSVSNQLQEQNEKKRQQEQQFKDYLSKLSKANRKLQTVQPTENNQYQGNRSVSDEVLIPTNTKIRTS